MSTEPTAGVADGSPGHRYLLEPRPLRRGELTIVAGALALLTFALTITHILHGGFYDDDWGVLTAVHFHAPGAGSTLTVLWHYYSKRPGEVAWYAFLDTVFGYDAHAQLALAAALLWAEITALCAVLRVAGLALVEALAIAALALTFPFSDSLWLWAILSMTTVTTTVYLAGVLAALRAFDSRGWRAVTLHAFSLACYLAGILSYEVFAVLGCLIGALYVRKAGWRRARWRWALDVVAILGTLAIAKVLLPNDVATPVRTQGLHGMLHHGELILRQGARIFVTAAEPFGRPPSAVGPVVLAAIVIAGVYAWSRPRSCDDATRALLARALAIALAGIVVALAAWAIYLPAIDYYSPGTTGGGNRTNGLAGVGIVCFVVACTLIVGTLATRRRSAGRAVCTAVVLLTILGGGYLHRTFRDTGLYDRAATDQHAILTAVRETIPSPPAHVRIYTLGEPWNVAAWIPVFAHAWDLSSALRQVYDDRFAAGAPISFDTAFDCTAGEIYPTDEGYSQGDGGRYGQTFVVDVPERRSVAITDRAACLRFADSLGHGVP